MDAAQLTESHRLAQVRLGIRTVTQMFAAFPVLDPANVDATTAAWLRVTVPLIEQQRVNSATLAASYYRLFRTLEIGADPKFVPTLDSGLDARAAVTSLTVTGPVSLKRAALRGVDFGDAIDTAKSASARAAMRLALNGGRSTIQNTIRDDRRAVGFQRVTSGRPCDFCDMLAGRGAVYKDDTVDFEAHDGCACTSEPVLS